MPLRSISVDRRQDFIFDFESEVGLAVEHVVDHVLVLRQVDLGLGGGAFLRSSSVSDTVALIASVITSDMAERP